MVNWWQGRNRRVIVGGGFMVALAAAAWFWPVTHYSIRSPYCSRLRAVLDRSAQSFQMRYEEEVLKTATMVRKEGRYELWQTSAGAWWIPGGWAPDRLLAALLAQQARNVYGEGEWGVRAGDVVLDCGAHVGVYTRKALNAGARLVVAIEPAPAALECLRRNFASEIASGKVIVYPKGVWDREDTLTFFLNGNGEAADSFVVQAPWAFTVKVPVTTVDNIAAELKLARVDFIKADIKGATERMIQGGRGVIARDHPRMALSTEEAPENPESINRLVNELFPSAFAMKCGPCLVNHSQVRTDAIFFRPR